MDKSKRTFIKSKRSFRRRLPPIQSGDRIDYRNMSLISRFISEQGKILTVLWQKEDGRATATDIALASGLANNTLTSMIKKLVDQGLVTIEQSDQDKRKKFVVLTELGWEQKEIGDRVSKELGEIFYQGFSNQEIREFEAYQERIITNLKAKENDM